MRPKLSLSLSLVLVSAALAVPEHNLEAATLSPAQDELMSGFLNPADSAKPRVWWHWMNGNVTPVGIRRDLEWMHRVGIGGVQNFDAAFETPRLVDQRLAFMSLPWKEAFRY